MSPAVTQDVSQTPEQSVDTGFTWRGMLIPCAVRVVVYQGGQAAGLGIQAEDRARLKEMLRDRQFARALPSLLHERAAAEIGAQGIKVGVDEDAVIQAVQAFIRVARKGSDSLVSRKIAEGHAPQGGEDARLEYILNPEGVPLSEMGKRDRRRALRRVHQVRTGQTLVLRRPPANAKPGMSVRGDPVKPGRKGRDESLARISGTNTEVRGERLVATVDGVYREDRQGEVGVVQELVVEEVSGATGDLPKAGIAAVNILIRRGVGSGVAVQTTEGVLVGTAEEMGSVDGASCIRSRHLVVRGLVGGVTLPEALLDGELLTLEEAEQQDIRVRLTRSQIQVEGVFAAREVMGRNITAGSALIQNHVQGAVLDVDGDLQIDGNLVGGLTVCGGKINVLGDLGSRAGATTRIQLGMESPTGKRRRELAEELKVCRQSIQRHLAAADDHRSVMATRGRKSRYWASLLEGDKRPPAKPIERRLLRQFLDGSRTGRRLEEALSDARQQARGLERMLRKLEGAAEESLGGVRIRVGGTAHAGVRLEAIRPLVAADDDRAVRDRKGRETTLARVRARLVDRLERYLALYEDGLNERRQALDRMFEEAENRPEAPKLPDRRFEASITMSGGGKPGKKTGLRMLQEGKIFVHAHDPTAFYLRQTATLGESVKQAAISVDELAGCLVFTCSEGAKTVRSWQRSNKSLGLLDRIQVTGISGRHHLLE